MPSCLERQSDKVHRCINAPLQEPTLRPDREENRKQKLADGGAPVQGRHDQDADAGIFHRRLRDLFRPRDVRAALRARK